MNWYLVSVRPNKRDLFLKHLDFAIDKNQLRELFLDSISPSDPMYKDMVLIQISNLKLAQTQLRGIEHFQRIEPRPLSEKQIGQFLGK
ncbi:hypothetical protein VB715_18940 [Crocosphaera sp. UHCC 0190]|uniref:hypothetical protein n=1 Tax=Crocosphaera sp. UHCC 0190 TaxID=3110246 RepID=UPI002B1F18E5|nr:hypothetical protein [Crocosphaera sp. UHCC 0190]MEA5511852.1 hypothetical protein [Crocosphaera sp. UHCC 0190]